MQTATHIEELIVWTKPQALEEAKSVFASYGPKFRTVANDTGPVLSKGQGGRRLLVASRRRPRY